MKEYILIILFVIIIILLLRPSKSKYGTTDSFVTFFQIGSDVDPAVTPMVLSQDNSLSIDAINAKLWTDPAYSSYWGFRKVLQDGGYGNVYYLNFANDDDASYNLTRQADILKTFNYQGTNYYIPTSLIVKKSLDPVLYLFTTFKFTSLGFTGTNGPNSVSVYGSNIPGYNTSYVTVMSSVRGVQMWTVPATRYYTFNVAGASGGSVTTGSKLGGAGNIVSGTLYLTYGTRIYIIVGQAGASSAYQAGGGGGSFVFKDSIAIGNLLFGAGGGGGATHGYAGSNGTTSTDGGDGARMPPAVMYFSYVLYQYVDSTDGYPRALGGSHGTSGTAGGGGGTIGGYTVNGTFLSNQNVPVASGNSTDCSGGGGGSGQFGGGGGGGVGSIATTASFVGGTAGTGTYTGSTGGFGGGGGSSGGFSGGGGGGGGGGYSGGGGGGGSTTYGGSGGGGGSFITPSVASSNMSAGTNTGAGSVTVTAS